MSFSTLVVRGRRVAEIAEEYDQELSSLPRDIRDDLIAAQQAHIEALADVVIELGRQTMQPRMDTNKHELVIRPSLRVAWDALMNALRPRWL